MCARTNLARRAAGPARSGMSRRAASRRTSRVELERRGAHQEPPAPIRDEPELVRDLFPQVPWKDENDVWARPLDLVRVADRDVAPRQVAPLLVRVAVDREVDELGADPAEVEERVAFRRRAVSRDPPAVVLEPDQRLEDVALFLVDRFAETEISLDMREARPFLARFQLADHVGDGEGAGMACVDAQRAAMRVELVDVEHRQVVGG